MQTYSLDLNFTLLITSFIYSFFSVRLEMCYDFTITNRINAAAAAAIIFGLLNFTNEKDPIATNKPRKHKTNWTRRRDSTEKK